MIVASNTMSISLTSRSRVAGDLPVVRHLWRSVCTSVGLGVGCWSLQTMHATYLNNITLFKHRINLIALLVCTLTATCRLHDIIMGFRSSHPHPNIHIPAK